MIVLWCSSEYSLLNHVNESEQDLKEVSRASNIHTKSRMSKILMEERLPFPTPSH